LGYPTLGVRRILVPYPVDISRSEDSDQEKRSPDKRAKDILYLHGTIQIFGSSLGVNRKHLEQLSDPRCTQMRFGLPNTSQRFR
jgi:hypothetical protein